jgi:serine/threonine protein kinase
MDIAEDRGGRQRAGPGAILWSAMDVADDRERVGRYEVVCRLARGGMAEILLGRLTGPSGFERTVVIKRILPAYTEEQSFVDMFLDEARIAARIHHPNVVQHQELGQDGEQLYLVMEYLDGESLASVQRRSRSRAAPLSHVEAIHIVASAAAGLHAAHEMTDHEGEALGIVHRDISPQNLFVTYRGGVKVMDFGIAKASDRITTTEAGSLKGKIRYMSPEQARGERLDRRSDLFSLGIVLYEITTGHALFRRRTPLASLRAVQDGPIPPPSTIVPDYPAALEAIVMRALARDRDERFDDVEAFRTALLDVLEELGPETRPAESLAAHMERSFADRIMQKREMVRRVSRGAALDGLPESEVDSDVEIPSVVVEWPEESATQAPSPPRRKRGRALSIAAAVLLAVVAAGGVLYTLEGAEAEDARPPVHALAPPSTPATELEPGEPVPDADPVRVTVESDPTGATIRLAGESAGQTPATLSIERGAEAVAIELSRRGYQPLETEVVPDVDQRLRLSLQREPRGRRHRAPAKAMEPDTAPEPAPFPRFN